MNWMPKEWGKAILTMNSCGDFEQSVWNGAKVKEKLAISYSTCRQRFLPAYRFNFCFFFYKIPYIEQHYNGNNDHSTHKIQ